MTAFGAGSVVTVNNSQITTLGAGDNATHVYSEGIQAGNGGSVQGSGNTISTSGSASYGIEASDGGTINLTGGSITTTGNLAAGVRTYSGDGSTLGPGVVTLDGTTINTSGVNAAGLLAGDLDGVTRTAGVINASNVIVTTTGSGTSSAPNAAMESAYGSTITSTNSTLRTEGLYGYGAYAHDGGAITLNGGSVTTANAKGQVIQDGDGSRAYALYANGAGSSVSATGTTILTDGQRAYGAYATNGGTVSLDGGSITTNGFMAYGLYSSGANSVVNAHNVNITTTGDVGDAVWAYAGGVTNIDGGTISVTGVPNVNVPHETANGLVAVGGLGSTAPGTINASNLTLQTAGPDSVGVKVGSLIGTDYTSGVVNLANSNITVTGSGSVAAEVNYGSSFTATGSKLVSSQSDGIVMNDNANVTLNNTTVQAAGASLRSELDTAGVTQSVTVGQGSVLTQNNGTLLQVNRNTAGMDGTVALALQDGSFAQGNVYDPSGANQVTVTKGANAHWAGLVVDSTTHTVDPSSSPTQSDFSSSGSVVVGGTTPVEFTGTTNVGGDFSGATGGSTTFSGSTNITGNLVGAQGSSTSFTGPTTVGSVTGGSGSSISFTGSSTTIQGNVSGNQGTQITFSKGGSTTIGGSVNLSGSGTSTHGGTITNPIIVQGDVTVGSGATLGGNITSSGSLGGSGGTVGPGNSVGVQSYATSAGFTGNYFAEVNAAGQSDLLIIRSGNFDLSGIGLTVGQENRNGGYVLNHKYTIIQTPGGSVVNKFASTGLDSSFAGTLVKLDPVIYDPQDVQVTLSVDNSAVSNKRAGLSANQNATLDGVLSVAGKNTAADAALQSTDTGGVLNQLSGEVHASTQAALLNTGDLMVRTLADRMRGNLGAPMAAGAPVAAAGALPAGAMPQSSALPVWAQVVGNWQTLKGGDDGAARSKLSLGGLYLGGDTQVGDGWRVGAALGYTNGRLDVDDRDSRSDVNSYSAAIYGGKSWQTAKGRINFLAGAGYTRNNIDSRRNVTVGGNQALKASYHADSTQLFTELGYAMPMGRSSSIEPYARVTWINLRAQGFDESGGAAALHGDSNTDSLTTLTLGLRGATELAVGAHTARLTAGLGWRHAGGDVNPKTSLSFIQGSGASFNVAGAPIAKDAAVLDLGAEMAVGKQTAVGLSYNGQYGAGNSDSAGTLYLKMRF